MKPLTIINTILLIIVLSLLILNLYAIKSVRYNQIGDSEKIERMNTWCFTEPLE